MSQFVKDDWENQGWVVGHWVYSHLAEGQKPIVITTRSERNKTRFEVNHPMYKAFVFYNLNQEEA
jgi:hypothetical protein